MANKLNKKKAVKGDISAATLVSIILLVIGFGIVLMFIVRIYYSESVDTNACKESVTLRGLSSAASPFGVAESLVNLRCKTQKICITSKLFGGDCTENYGRERVLNKKVKNENGVAKVIADEVLNCWDMTGQGRLSLFSPGLTAQLALRSSETTEDKLGSVYSSCIICSRVAFDAGALKKQGIDLDKVDVYDYMTRFKAPGEELSYSQLIAAGSPAGVSLADKDVIGNISKDIEKQLGSKLGQVQAAKTPPKSGELAVIFMNIEVPTGADVVKKLLGATLGGGYVGGKAINFASFGYATKGLLKVATVHPVAAIAVAVGTVVVGGTYAGVNYYSNYQTAAGHCGDMPFGGEDSYGCTAIRVIPYDAESIKQFCDAIESIS